MKIPTQCHLWHETQLTPDDLGSDVFEILETFVQESHLIRRLLKCKDCGQLYNYEFIETIDWAGGQDAQRRTYTPVDCTATFILYDWPSDGPSNVSWIGKGSESLAEQLVRTQIPGMRKGTSDKPQYLHSIHVFEILKQSGYGPNTCLAGLLHDIIEDGGQTANDLRAQGFAEAVVRLVELCTHDSSIQNKDARWVVMMAGLVRANDLQAWAIKVADLIDNLRDSGSLQADRKEFIRTIKKPLIERVTQNIINTELKELLTQT